jgi:alkylated DNA repair dioxygenase AlkB
MRGYKNVSQHIDIEIQDDYLDEEFREWLLEDILRNVNFPYTYLTKKGIPSRRRNKVIFGEIEHYVTPYAGDLKTEVKPWSEYPILKEIADDLERNTGQKFHVCVIQVYNTGLVGIDHHRDKEMASGTIIASLSLGCTRVMNFKYFDKEHNFLLPSGSLCLINPPTNDYWTHAIPKDDTVEIRISLIFRNCHGMI